MKQQKWQQKNKLNYPDKSAAKKIDIVALIILLTFFLLLLTGNGKEEFGKPVNLNAVAGNGQATLKWNNSDAYEYYELIVNHIHNCVETPYTVGNLTNGLTYVFSIIGYDNNENSTGSLGDVVVSPLEGL